MRIALIGDLQYATAEEERLADKFDAIRALSPDFAVMMGDFGGSHSKSLEGHIETREHMDRLGCGYELILGNHDVEYRAGEPITFDPHGMLWKVFGKKPFNSFVLGGVLFICVSTDRQPPEGMRTINSVYVTDGHFEWIKSELRAHPGVPTVLITHAPAAGSGLRRWLPLHCSATDGYLDQTFNALRWRDLPREFPQIKLWCSAHFHMCHDYDSAITERDGVVHVSCGAMTVCARDDVFQTRILDITPDMRAVISTYDHTLGKLRRDAETYLTGEPRTTGNFRRIRGREMQLGDDRPTKVWALPPLGRAYVATENGLLWEYEEKLDEFNGALTLSTHVNGLSFDGGRLYLDTAEKGIFSVEADGVDRLERYGSFTAQDSRPEATMKGDRLAEIPYSTRDSKEGLYVSF